MSWCGKYRASDRGSPCIVDVTAAVVFLLVACLVLTLQIRRIRLLSRHRYTTTHARWKYFCSAGLYGVNVVVHATWFVLSLVLKEAAGFQIFTEATLCAVWGAVLVRHHCRHIQLDNHCNKSEPLLGGLLQVTCWQGRAVTVSMRPLPLTAIALYAVRVFTSAKVLVTHQSTASFGLAILATACTQMVLMVAASVTEILKCAACSHNSMCCAKGSEENTIGGKHLAVRKQSMPRFGLMHWRLQSTGGSMASCSNCRLPTKEEADALKEALLGQDVELQRQKNSRSWLSLLGTAVGYVWPGVAPLPNTLHHACQSVQAFVAMHRWWTAKDCLIEHACDCVTQTALGCSCGCWPA